MGRVSYVPYSNVEGERHVFVSGKLGVEIDGIDVGTVYFDEVGIEFYPDVTVNDILTYRYFEDLVRLVEYLEGNIHPGQNVPAVAPDPLTEIVGIYEAWVTADADGDVGYDEMVDFLNTIGEVLTGAGLIMPSDDEPDIRDEDDATYNQIVKEGLKDYR